MKIRGETLSTYNTKKGIDHPKCRWPYEVVQEVRNLYLEEVPLSVISKVKGISMNTIRGWIYRGQREHE